MSAVKLSPPLISNLTRDFKFRGDTKRFPYVRGFLVNVNILLNIIISQSIATATINSGTSGWKQEIIMGQCPIIALGGRYCQNLTVNLTRSGSSFSTTQSRRPTLITKAQNRRIRAPLCLSSKSRNSQSLLCRLSVPEMCKVLSVSCESRHRPT